MNPANTYTYNETKGGASLHWTNRVDAAGSRVEWCAVSDSQGWVCHLGPVHNDGVAFGSKIVTSPSEEKMLLDSLRLQFFGTSEAPQPMESQRQILAA